MTQGISSSFARVARLAGLAVLGILAAAHVAHAAQLTEAQILGEADARIEQIRKSDATLRLIGPDGKSLPAGTAVMIEQTRHEFLFGCNIFALLGRQDDQINEDYARRFADLFNFATLGFYWASYEAAPGKTREPQTRKILTWCQDHGVTAKGHPLLWNTSDPQWLPADPAQAHDLQMARIKREMKLFAGQIQYWDVANELTEYDRASFLTKAPRMTGMIKAYGPDKLGREAFTLARATDPQARLIINDYKATEDYATKVLDKLVDDRGAALYDIIGIQSHQHGKPWPVEQIWRTCERFAKFGKPIHFTETTFCSGREGVKMNWEKTGVPDWPSTPEGEQRQARDVVRFYTTLFSHPAVQAITWWDLSDKNAWLRAPAGLIRADMTPKPAYEELMKLVKGKWWTKETGATGENGSVKLWGFRGDYRVTVKGADGKTVSGTFMLKSGMDGAVEVKLAESGK